MTRAGSVVHRTLGRGVLPEQASFLLTSRARAILQYPPRVLAERLGPCDGRLLELGPGPGYFTPTLTDRLGPGRVTMVDLQRGMLERAARRVESRSAPVALAVQADATRLPFRDGAFAAAVAVTVMGELPDIVAGASELHRVTKPGGVLIVSEHWSDPDFQPFERVRQVAEVAGYHLDERTGSDRNYIARFTAAG